RRTALRSSDFPLHLRLSARAERSSSSLRRPYCTGWDWADPASQPLTLSPEPSALSPHPYPCHLPVGFLGDLVLLEFLVQIAARRVDDFGGLRDVPPVLAELRDEIGALGTVL